jgi:hypothetical protein
LLSFFEAGKLARKMSSVIVIWIWLCAYLNGAGWTLSALHQLNRTGYTAVFAIGLLALLIWKKQTGTPVFPKKNLTKLRRRFRHAFPLAYLVLASLAFLGGALYATSNYDALAYRIPRILHWLAAERWHWIGTVFDRVNDRSCGIEWVSAPVIAFLHTDRLLFLINIVSFLLLPGLVFSVFRRLGVRRRVAWHWMWLAPTAYGLVLQAGSVGNDLFGAVFALAAVDFALRAKDSRRAGDFFASILAAAMMTSAKTSSLPLLLPCAVALLPSLKLILRWPLRTVLVLVLAASASALPTIVLNLKFSGDWSGARVGAGDVKHAVLWRGAANVTLLTIENFVPPVFPVAEKWNRAVTNNLPADVQDKLGALIEYPGCKLVLEQMQIEENAGLGFGISCLLLASVIAALFLAKRQRNLAGIAWGKIVRWSAFISLLAVLAVSNLTSLARVLTPYYALLLPLLLVGAGQAALVRKKWWRVCAFAVFAMAAGLLVISPARPLFPVLTILDRLPHPPARVLAVYKTYRERPDAMAPVREHLPADLNVLGLATFDDPETSLWRPFGSRRIDHIAPDDSSAALKARGINYVLFRAGVAEDWFKVPLAEWLQKHNAQIVQTIPLNMRASTGSRDWYLVRLN